MIPQRLLRASFTGLVPILFAFAGCAARTVQHGSTTLSDPTIKYELVKSPSVQIQWGAGEEQMLHAALAGNDAVGTAHKAGYNGLAELHYGNRPSPFVQSYAGLNLEHVLNGKNPETDDLRFEPRRQPMEIRKIDDQTYELYQAALPETGLESCVRFEFHAPHYIDVTFECVPRKDNFPHGYLNVFWASYIAQPRDPAIYFTGRLKGDLVERWIRAHSPKHGEAATHRGSTDRRDFEHDTPFDLTLVFNESEDEYTRPFYYGRFEKFVWEVMFHQKDLVRLTQSPSGGGEGNPAWDFQWFIEHPRKDQLYRLQYRALYKPWLGVEDVVDEYEKFRRESASVH